VLLISDENKSIPAPLPQQAIQNYMSFQWDTITFLALCYAISYCPFKMQLHIGPVWCSYISSLYNTKDEMSLARKPWRPPISSEQNNPHAVVRGLKHPSHSACSPFFFCSSHPFCHPPHIWIPSASRALQLDSFIHLHLGIHASNLPKDLECHHLIINDLYTDLCSSTVSSTCSAARLFHPPAFGDRRLQPA